MRWNSQAIGADDELALPGLGRVAGLIRTVRTPEFAGVTFHEVHSKSVLNHVPGNSPMPFGWTINPYRGCTHGCVYCFARGTHSYLEFDTGHDFDTQIVVKLNVAQVLRRELARTSWVREHVAMGTNTDPYQRAEGRYRLMPGIIDALVEAATPFSILTKGTVLSRDLPLLTSAQQQVPVGLGISLALLDPELQALMEPGTPTPKARLDLIRRITDAGLPCGVLVAPLLPHLTDGTEQLRDLVGQLADAGVTGVSAVVLHLRPGAREWFFPWLARTRPDLVPIYERLYARGSTAAPEFRSMLSERFRAVRAEFGLDAGDPPTLRGLPGDPRASFPVGSLPGPVTPAVAQQALF